MDDDLDYNPAADEALPPPLTLPPPKPVHPSSSIALTTLHPTLALVLGIIMVFLMMVVIGVVFLFVFFLLMATVNAGLRLVIPHYHSTFWIKFAVVMFICFVWFAFQLYAQSQPAQ